MIEIAFVCGALSAIGLVVFAAGVTAELLGSGNKATTASTFGLILFLGATGGLYWTYTSMATSQVALTRTQNLDEAIARADRVLRLLQLQHDASN